MTELTKLVTFLGSHFRIIRGKPQMPNHHVDQRPIHRHISRFYCCRTFRKQNARELEPKVESDRHGIKIAKARALEDELGDSVELVGERWVGGGCEREEYFSGFGVKTTEALCTMESVCVSVYV